RARALDEVARVDPQSRHRPGAHLGEQRRESREPSHLGELALDTEPAARIEGANALCVRQEMRVQIRRVDEHERPGLRPLYEFGPAPAEDNEQEERQRPHAPESARRERELRPSRSTYS